MAMMASKADVNAEVCAGLVATEEDEAVVDWRVRSVEEADEPRRSPAEGPRKEEDPPSPLAVLADWICEAE
jgi:hypothetical protein